MKEMDDNRVKVENVIRDTFRNIRYVILAERKLTREEMLKQIKNFLYEPTNIRQKAGTTVYIEYDADI